MIPFGSIVSASTHTILAVAQSGEFDAYFEVECTNDHAHVERFNYDKKEIAIAVAQSQSIHFKEVAVHAVFSYYGEWNGNDYTLKSLKKTIYHETCEEEDIVLTADGEIPASEMQKRSEEE